MTTQPYNHLVALPSLHALHTQPHFHTETPNPPHNTTPYAHHHFIGDYLQENKPETITRIYCQNLNGIKWDKDGGTWPMICESMAAIHADIACFSEINQDVSQYKVRMQMDKICKRFFHHHRLDLQLQSTKYLQTRRHSHADHARHERYNIQHHSGQDGKMGCNTLRWQKWKTRHHNSSIPSLPPNKIRTKHSHRATTHHAP